MKKLLSCLLICTMLFSFLPVMAAADGETVITTPEQFDAIRNDLTGSYKLGGNITLPADYLPIEYFAGVLDGANYTVTLDMNGTTNTKLADATAYGLFGTLKSGATIKNLVIDGTVTGQSGKPVGALAGITDTTAATLTVDHVVNKADIYFYAASNTAQAGGLIGLVKAAANTVTNISNCENRGTIQPAADSTLRGDTVGGIVGQINSVQGSVSNCYNYGTVKNANSGRHTGGIVGNCSGQGYTVEKCGNYGTVTSNERGAGIVSYMNLGSTVTKCFNAGEVTCTYGAGIVYNDNFAATSIDNCFNAGTVTGGPGIINGHGATKVSNGGAAGYTPVTSCYNVGTVSANPISNTSNADIAAVAANNYYIAGTAGQTSSADITAGKTTTVTEEALSSALPTGFDPDIWEMSANSVYQYPQLIGNNYVMALEGEDTTNYAGGNGTAQYPYLISNATHFANISLNPDKAFKQTGDITVSAMMSTTFTGTYDGDNKTIVLALSNEDSSVVGFGLFKANDTSAVFKNIVLDGSVESAGTYVGALIGSSVGGSVTNVVNKASVTGGERTGGLIGSNADYRITMTNCRNEGTVTGNGKYTGGIAGFGYHVYGTNLVNIGTIKGGFCTGGLIGAEHATLFQSYNAGNVTGDSQVAGINAQARANITDCYNVGRIKGAGAVSGVAYIAHANATITISDCFNAGEVVATGTSFQGVGMPDTVTAPTVTNCYYLDPTANANEAVKGQTAVTREELKTKISLLGAEWEANANGYPQLTANKPATALNIALLTVAAADNGTVTPGTRYIPVGAYTSETYIPADGYRLASAALGSTPVIAGTDFLVSADATLTAVFEEIPKVIPSVTAVENPFVVDGMNSITFAVLTEGYGYDVVEYGVVYSTDVNAISADTPDSCVQLPFVATETIQLNDQGQFGIYAKGAALPQTGYYTRAYVTYEESEGVTKTVYSTNYITVPAK